MIADAKPEEPFVRFARSSYTRQCKRLGIPDDFKVGTYMDMAMIVHDGM